MRIRLTGILLALTVVALSAQTGSVAFGNWFEFRGTGVSLKYCATDPSTGGGLAAAVGSFCTGPAGIFNKTGAGATAWTAAGGGSIQTLLDGISTTQGAVLYRNAADWVALSPGTNGQFLQTQGAAANPQWATAAGAGGVGGGAWSHIQTQTLGSPAASISFTSIASAYTHLRLFCNGRTADASTTAAVALRFNNDTGANYDRQDFWAVQTGSSITNAFAQTFARVGILTGNTGSANYSGVVDAFIANYAGTTFTKQVISTFANANATSGNGTLVGMHEGHWRSTAAITRVDLLPESGANLSTGTTCSLYGVSQDAVGGLPTTAEGRLTTESGVCVSTTDRTAQGTVYYTPGCSGAEGNSGGNKISLWNGSAWQLFSFSEVSLAVSCTSGQNKDVWLREVSGTPTLDFSAAWTNDTTRSEAIAMVDGVWVKSGDTTRRLVGSIRCTGSNVTEDSGGGVTTQVGAKRFVCNAQNQVDRPMAVVDKTDTWSWTNASWQQANGNAGNQIEWMACLPGSLIEAEVNASAHLQNNSSRASVAVGIDSTSTPSGIRGGYGAFVNSAFGLALVGIYRGHPGLGWHRAVWLEHGGGGTTTFDGDGGLTIYQSGMRGKVRQ